MSKDTKNRYQKKDAALQKQVFGEIVPDKIWHRKRANGFTTMPRTMPLIGGIMDALSGKGKPLSTTYLELWCRSDDEGFVKASKHAEIAYAAGFSGQRGVSTWKERVRRLEALEFLTIGAGVAGNLHYVQLWNPYHVIKKHKIEQTDGFLIDRYNALFERALEIGANDLDE